MGTKTYNQKHTRPCMFLLMALLLSPIAVYPCSTSYKQSSERLVTLFGTIRYEGLPCIIPEGGDPEEYPCAPCEAPGIYSEDIFYYFNDFDDSIDGMQLQYGDSVIARGYIAEEDGYHYINLLLLNEASRGKMKHICDRWNLLEENRFELGPIAGEIWTSSCQLSGDTLISGREYSKVMYANGWQKSSTDEWEWFYHGALRETENAEMYFVPSGDTKEYFLCAFNAKIGDVFDNLYVKRDYIECSATVTDVTETDIFYRLDFNNKEENHEYSIENQIWIRGIGKRYGLFLQYDIFDAGGLLVDEVLCAYRGEEQVYSSEFANENGCEYWEGPMTDVEELTPQVNSAKMPAYNVLGIPVSDSYKGIVIRNGRKELRE